MPPIPVRFFDAHLDLAYLAVCGRDMLASPGAAGGPHPPAAITLPALLEGNVARCLGTIFTERNGSEPCVGYHGNDPEAAHAAGAAQLAVYERWRRENVPRPRIELLMECADPIRTPDELSWWVDRGVRAVGMAWARGSRYAGGNLESRGLTAMGRELVKEIDRLGVLHDVSHLSDAAMDELLALTDRPVIASHSNCRSVLDPRGTLDPVKAQRHLRDQSIREIARRGGVIGLNLYAAFLRTADASTQVRPTIDDALAHVEHIRELTRTTACVGIGSDTDGGFSADELPEGISGPGDLSKLTAALRARGWNEADIAGFAHGNWERLLDGRRTAERPIS